MERTVPSLYKEYGLESNIRMLPFIIDGLRPSERRVLVSANEIAKDRFKKSLTVDSHTTGHYHAHGSTYGTVVQLVRQGLLEGQGNFGSEMGTDPDSTKPAASRYTECKLSDLSKKMCFKLIKYVPFQVTEVDVEKKEPTYLPTMFPCCLLGRRLTEGIGFGYKPVIPCYNISDLSNRLLYLLGRVKEKPTIKPNTNCEILSDNNELEELLTKGKSKLSVRGWYEHDPLNKKLVIRSIPPKLRFETILKKLDRELSNEDISWIDKSSSMYGGTYIEFKVDKQRNVDKIYNNMISKIDAAITTTLHLDIIVIDEDLKIRNSSVDEMLLKCYYKYVEICKEMLQDNINKLDATIKEFNNLKLVRPHLIEYIKNNQRINNYGKAIKEISSNSGVSEEIVKSLFSRYSISKLLTLEIDTNAIEKDKKKYKSHLKDPDNYVIQDYQNFVEGENNV